MSAEKPSPSSLDGEIITIRRGLAIYKVHNSPYWMCRIRDTKNKRNIVRSTKETSRIEARKAAEEFAGSIFADTSRLAIPKNYRFDYFADLLLKQSEIDIERGVRAKTHTNDLKRVFFNKSRGLIKIFGNRDVREITTKDFTDFIRKILQTKSELSSSTHNQMRIGFRKVMKMALMEGAIHSLPDAPKMNDTNKSTRTYFRFSPLVPERNDEYQHLLRVAEKLAKENQKVRGVPLTSELRDIILFTVHSFVRPVESELYALKHSDITVRDHPKRLQLTIRKGKTGRRMIDTMPAAVSVYNRILDRYPDNSSSDDYLFLPTYKNRDTAKRIIMRQFNFLLEQSGLKVDSETGISHSMYSLRHTCLMMRCVLSDGEVNMFALAKNAGTSMEMLNRFYISQLPMTNELARNIQSFGKRSKKEKLLDSGIS